jgi:serine protease Do
MADRPDPDHVGPPASYSPPPNHRPEWIANGWGRQDAPGPAQGVRPGWPASSSDASWSAPTENPSSVRAGGTASGTRGLRSGAAGAAAMVLAAAFTASIGTYGLLLASGRLDRPVVVAEPAAVQAANRLANPDVVRVVEDSAVTEAVDKVSPAVVTIVPRSVSGGRSYPEGVGSGVIYDPNGWIITNRHVVCNADGLGVTLADGHQYDGELYGIDTLTDLAIVKIEGTGLPAVEVGNSSTLKVGQHAIAIGSPLGTFTNSVTAGVVSAIGRHIDVDDACSLTSQTETLRNLIQTDAAINPGNSGGALVDAGGALIGINTAIAGDAQGIGFAIPINLASPIMQQAVEGESLTRPWMGVIYQDINPLLQEQRGLMLGYGALIAPPDGTSGSAVLAGSPADTAGLRDGDIITHLDGTRVDGDNPLEGILTQYHAGETVSLRVLRGDQVLDLSLVLGTRPAAQ